MNYTFSIKYKVSTVKITCTEKYVLLNQKFNFDFPHEYTEYQQLDQKQFYEKVHDQDVIILSDLNIDEQILQNNPNLKLVALCSTGFNHINLPLLKKHGVKVCNIRGQATDAVAEHAFTFMINLIKNFKQQINVIEQGVWSSRQTAFCLAAPMKQLKNKTLTIIGKGNIGLSLAEKAKAFGMRVIFSERKNAQHCREGYIPFNEAIQQADILSLHCTLNEQTQNLINLAVLKQMKKTSVLINLGRGGLVNDQDLVLALENHLISGFATDVLTQEPPAANHPLLNIQHPNVLITGHIAWATDEAQQLLFDILQDNINKNMTGIDQNLV
ncbi:NAD(P)-dependent oxidoreductase [Acinetobacter stercoris]|uniref:NAD(P)-dependent oxidoreductase n=1 Tax=Acinetobacter stercoris TaxID=2126983 RepID=UPI000EFA93EC|nr:NAD(P)-dependent oxidoreductase [Acinetobacter stercoris]